MDIGKLHGRTSLITGASSGIGLEFAGRLAQIGSDLVLVARREERLVELAADLRQTYGVAVEVAARDLARATAAAELVDDLHARGRTIDVLINNAGFGAHGDLASSDPGRMDELTLLNVGTVVGLASRLLPGMIARGSGVIINVASTAAFQPVPHMAVYGASKAFVLSFSRALWAETPSTGVNVMALCPGSTDSEFFDVAGEAAAVGRRRTPEQVVETALRALARGAPSVVDGRKNGLLAGLSSRLPEKMSISAAERGVRPAQ